MFRIAPTTHWSAPPPPAAPERLPTHQTTLSVSWLDGHVRALAVHKGSVENSWECPDPVPEAAGLGGVLRQAVAETGYKGSSVSLTLAHPRLGQQLLSVPAARSTNLLRFIERQMQSLLYLGVPPDLQPTLVRYIQRQAQNLKAFDGDAAWCFEYAMPVDGATGILLHLFPRQILDTLIDECTKADLHLTSVVPATAVLQSQLQHLAASPNDVAMLVGDLGHSTAVVVGRPNGQVLLSRVLAGHWAENASRVLVDLQRTALFVKEEYGVNVASVWLFGTDSREHLAQVQVETGIPTGESPVAWDPFYWARTVLLLAPEISPNFISREQLNAPKERLWLKLVAVGAMLLVPLCLGTTYYLERLVRDERANLKNLQTRIADVEKRRAELQAFAAQLEAKQQLVKLVAERRVAPVPGWFLGYLSETVPSELLLTNVQVTRQEDQWHLKLAGVLQPSTNEPPATLLSNAVAQLRQRLATGPFHVAFLSETNRPANTPPVAARTPALASWVAQLSAIAAGRDSSSERFTLEGVME